MNEPRRFGPGFLVAAAFVGPGTITTASLAGASGAYTLAWALAFAVVATLVLQEMSARLGVVTGGGLGEAIRARFPSGLNRWISAGLVITAIGIGNAAYQGGNLSGAAIGLQALIGGESWQWVWLAAGLAAALLWTGTYRVVTVVLVALVVLMSVVFLLAAMAAQPDLPALLQGLLLPRLGDAEPMLALALVGTTVVPYNLFLHASAAARQWQGVDPAAALRSARRDGRIGILIGGLISLAILVSAVPLHRAGLMPDGVAGMARQLEPVLGHNAQLGFAIGLAAAGFTSAVTAPLAAAWAVAGILGWPQDLTDTRLRAVWITVLLAGVTVATLGARPVAVILLAQAANGLLLPLVGGFLLWAVNDPQRMRGFGNRTVRNLLALVVLLLTVALGLRQLLRVFGAL